MIYAFPDFNAFSKLQNELERAKTDLEDRKTLDRAKGILMKNKGLTEDEAYRLMRSAAMREKKKIADIAAADHHRGGASEMTKTLKPVRIGFIPLVDAAALFVVVDKGFAVVEGLDIQLAREVSWSNVRDKLNIGLFDAAHLLAPMAIASSLGLGCAKVPIITPFTLAVNGNAITVSPTLYADLQTVADGDLVDPVSSARALARVVRQRKESGAELMTFGMTFPFSSHNYLLRYWMASGGVDPDEDVRLIVLPPPYMVENLAKKQVDGFCVGAPWNSIAVDAGLGRILHFGVRHLREALPKKCWRYAKASRAWSRKRWRR